MIHSVLAVPPHGCSVTPSPLNGTAAMPAYRPLFTPNGAYSFSTTKEFAYWFAVMAVKRVLPDSAWSCATVYGRKAWQNGGFVRPVGSGVFIPHTRSSVVKSSAGSLLLTRNRMIFWPTRLP